MTAAHQPTWGHVHSSGLLSRGARSPPDGRMTLFSPLMIACFLPLAILGAALLLEAGGGKNPTTAKTLQDFESGYYQRDCL